jgi:predicted GNAT family N-acyltransferase
MAVVASLRGSQVGRQMLDALVTAARQRGDRQVMLHAQASAVGFYRRLGWQPQGPAFVEAGIEHQEMVLALS